MYFVQRPTTLLHHFLLNPPSTEYIIPVLGPEKSSSSAKKDDSSNSGSTKKTDETKPMVVRSNVNVTEKEDGWNICMDMPGVKPENVTIEEKEGKIKVEAERKNGVHYAHRHALDPKKADLSKLEAELTHGVLTLTVPKKDAPAPVCIPVSSEEAPEIDDAHYYYTMDLPGVAAASLKLEFKDEKLLLHAERKRLGAASKIERVLLVQPSVDMSQGKAYLSDGVFTIIAPRSVDKEGTTETRKILVGSKKPAIETVVEGS